MANRNGTLNKLCFLALILFVFSSEVESKYIKSLVLTMDEWIKSLYFKASREVQLL